MKKIEVVQSVKFDENKFHVAVTSCRKYLLVQEKGSYIFRANKVFGHSGRHVTKEDCILGALMDDGTEIYEFDDVETLFYYLNQLIP